MTNRGGFRIDPLAYHMEVKFGEVLKDRRWLVGCSGGGDSVALAYLLFELRKRCPMDLILTYIHHGFVGNESLRAYRDLAESAVSCLAKKLDMDYVGETAGSELKGENAFRNFRRGAFIGLAKEREAFGVMLAHTSDDLMETRLMRLIRGTSLSGLQAMAPYDGFWLRPLLKVSRKELREFLTTKGLQALEDPSNSDISYFRNWLRKFWLEPLSKAYPGGVARLAESLDGIVREVKSEEEAFFSKALRIHGQFFLEIPRISFSQLSLETQMSVLSRVWYIFGTEKLEKTFFTEVIKRAEGRRKSGVCHIGQLQLEVTKTALIFRRIS